MNSIINDFIVATEESYIDVHGNGEKESAASAFEETGMNQQEYVSQYEHEGGEGAVTVIILPRGYEQEAGNGEGDVEHGNI